MERPSKHWSGYAGLSPESDKYKRIQSLLSADFEHVKTRGLELRRAHQPNLTPDIDCSVNLTDFTSGFQNLVLEVAFSDNVYWIARIPLNPLDDSDRTSLLSEIATMKIIKKQTTIPIPHIYGFEVSSDHPFGHPYVFMEYLGGRSLPNGLATTIPPQHHAKVAQQLANVFEELQTLTFSRIGRLWCGETTNDPVKIIAMSWHASPGPLDTSLEYFYNERQSENREIMVMYPNDPDRLTACWVLKQALTYMVIENRVRGPSPLCHLDLHYGNMLFDDEYNLTGVIDWSSAQAAPLEQLSVCPEFVTFPGLSEEENQPIVDLKRLVVEAIAEREREREKGMSLPLDGREVEVIQDAKLTALSSYMASKSAIITHRQYMATVRGSLWAGKVVAGLMYGECVSWEQLREMHGTMALF